MGVALFIIQAFPLETIHFGVPPNGWKPSYVVIKSNNDSIQGDGASPAKSWVSFHPFTRCIDYIDYKPMECHLVIFTNSAIYVGTTVMPCDMSMESHIYPMEILYISHRNQPNQPINT